MNRWSVGELAKASGVTVRTLHYYDEIGLVSPSERTSAGHRRYTEADIRRLYRVLALSQLGFSLDEISTALTNTAEDLRELFAAQLADLEIQASRIADLRQRVGGLLSQLDSSVAVDAEQFLSTLEPLTLLRTGTYLSSQQHEALTKRTAELGRNKVEAFKSEWLELLTQLRHHQTNDTPVDDPRVQQLVTRWQEISSAFQTGDERINEQIGSAAVTLWQDNHAELSEQLGKRMGWPDARGVADVVDYVQRARQELR